MAGQAAISMEHEWEFISSQKETTKNFYHVDYRYDDEECSVSSSTSHHPKSFHAERWLKFFLIRILIQELVIKHPQDEWVSDFTFRGGEMRPQTQIKTNQTIITSTDLTAFLFLLSVKFA